MIFPRRQIIRLMAFILVFAIVFSVVFFKQGNALVGILFALLAAGDVAWVVIDARRPRRR